MKIQYCWRCDAEVPMLDESEYEQVRAAYESCLRSVKNYREQHNAALKDTPLAELWRPVQRLYAQLTDVVGLDPEHILKHRISALGPPCVKCGRPLRTPQAKKCASCGHSRAA
jgi:hypothetical protein